MSRYPDPMVVATALQLSDISGAEGYIKFVLSQLTGKHLLRVSKRASFAELPRMMEALKLPRPPIIGHASYYFSVWRAIGELHGINMEHIKWP
jgi:hypothetical protein